MSEVYTQYRFYAIHHLMNLEKPFMTNDAAAANLKERIDKEIEKALSEIAVSLEENSGRIADIDIQVKPFGVGKSAFAMIEIVVNVSRAGYAVSAEGLERYAHPNLFQAQADGIFDYWKADWWRGHRVAELWQQVDGGDDVLVERLIFVDGSWYIMPERVLERIMEDSQ